MRHYYRNLPIVFLICGLALSGCAGGSGGGNGGLVNDHSSKLNEAKIAAVNEAARKMVGDTSASVTGLRAKASANGIGTDVCGYVATPANASTPLYVELRETNGVPAAERGQIGDTPQNSAKVRFMCRNHGEW